MHAAGLSSALFVAGIAASFLGSIVGLGGGFLVIPILRLFFHLPPTLTAGTSLFLVTANVASASISFWRQGRIDKRLAFTMGLLAIPGSVLGAVALQHFTTKGFDIAYGVILALFGVDLLRRGTGRHESGGLARLPWAKSREFHDRLTNATYVYSESTPIAAAAGVTTGFISSFFGIGGGILIVPLLLRGFLMPPHVVSATSQLIILLSSPFGLLAHGLAGDIDWLYALPLAAGGVLGAQFGADTARRLSSPALVRTLAVVLLLSAASLVAQHLI
ncbi:MAG: sulfite exporter TauE/SafE family protein [Candidatus Eremiobacteraeota bacterium]|nr:sulfite exporter TauE/SafE family protein [Candidatus Eremiobacteraeota bacterium]MBC5801641.1 sulfite exporter TauE/SafE family protein [Candidatus Eremiobacteraeota bacterium]MBC5822451.1 sulfite exporter TauE/SafE family protein [Candidatus Eremiobacteraeota bacterium]